MRVLTVCFLLLRCPSPPCLPLPHASQVTLIELCLSVTPGEVDHRQLFRGDWLQLLNLVSWVCSLGALCAYKRVNNAWHRR